MASGPGVGGGVGVEVGVAVEVAVLVAEAVASSVRVLVGEAVGTSVATAVIDAGICPLGDAVADLRPCEMAGSAVHPTEASASRMAITPLVFIIRP
jgi:hypothetical protein